MDMVYTGSWNKAYTQEVAGNLSCSLSPTPFLLLFLLLPPLRIYYSSLSKNCFIPAHTSLLLRSLILLNTSHTLFESVSPHPSIVLFLSILYFLTPPSYRTLPYIFFLWYNNTLLYHHVPLLVDSDIIIYFFL
jgi:hypothetical protein